MVYLTALWLPILVAAVFVFVASSIIHMATPLHKGEYKKMPAEDDVLAAMREAGVKPGAYMFPCPPSMKEMGTPEMVEKYEQGPVGFMQVFPNGPFKMGKSLALWFVYTIIVGIFTAYVVGRAFGPGTEYLTVFRFAGTVAILAYAVAEIPNSIWRGQAWGTTARHAFGGVIYGLLTAGVFGWLWPN